MIPVARIADMLLDPGASYEFNGRQYKYPDIRLIYWAGGNPFHHHQDLNRLQRAWQKPDTVIVHESWWTPTARHADIVLPATTTLERNDVGGSSRDSFILAMHRAIDPVGEARNDFDIFRALARRLGYEEKFTERPRRDGLVPARLRPGARERRRQGRRAAGLPAVLGRGLRRAAAAQRDYVLFENFRRDPQRIPSRRRPGGSRSRPSGRGLRLSGLPAAPVWIAPAEWLGSAAPDAFRCTSSPTSPPAACTARWIRGRSRAGRRSRGASRRGSIRPMRRGAGSRDGDVVRVFNAPRRLPRRCGRSMPA